MANRDMASFVQGRSAQRVATLDIDATVVETNKEEAVYSYRGFKAYQPLNVYWAEQNLLVHSEFRMGMCRRAMRICGYLKRCLGICRKV